MKLFFLTITLICTLLHLTLSQNDCLPTSCSPTGPTILFPFRLKDRQPARCGYLGFELYCTKNGITKFDLQFPITASVNNTNITISLQTTVSVWDIDYTAQKMQASKARSKSCLPGKNDLITTLNSSKFEVEPLGYRDGYTLFNCSDTRDSYGDQKINCLSGSGYEVITYASFYDITSLPPYSLCFKMYNISYVPDRIFSVDTNDDDDVYGTRFDLRWREPSCGDTCEKNGKYCRLRNGGGDEEIECFGHKETQHDTGASRSHKTLITVTAGLVILTFITIASYFILRTTKQNRKKDQKRIEDYLENHNGTNTRPTRFSYADVNKITCNFKNQITTRGVTLHEGMLVDGTHVVVKMIDVSDQNIEGFITGVEIIGQMQHPNVLQLIGYCVDHRKRALVYKFMQAHTTLESHINTLDEKILHRVALGIAKGISYVRRNLDDINPKDIFLDDNLDPKILVFPTEGTYGDVSSKNIDVFSFGMLVLEVLGRRKNEVYVFPFEWIYNEMGKKDEENEIVKKLIVVGLWCIQWFPSDRPSMKCVVQMLEGDKMPIMPPNPFHLNGARMN